MKIFYHNEKPCVVKYFRGDFNIVKITNDFSRGQIVINQVHISGKHGRRATDILHLCDFRVSL